MSLMERIRSLFIETNPVPVKTVLAWQKVIAHPTVRLPLTALSAASAERVRAVFGL
jgi:dihydrodipicolinate synthase/N-acetylneuraminate lyase